MDRNVEPSLALLDHEEVVDTDDVIGVPGEGRPQDSSYPDRVLVDMRFDVFRPDRVLVGLQRDDSRFDIEVTAKFLPYDVHVPAEDEVRTVRRLPGRFASFAPVPLQGQCTEHDRLGRPLGPSACGLRWRMEQVGEHPDAPLLELGGARVLGVIDEIAVQVVRDQPLGLGLHPGRYERREIAHRRSVDHQLPATKRIASMAGIPTAKRLGRCFVAQKATTVASLQQVQALTVRTANVGGCLRLLVHIWSLTLLALELSIQDARRLGGPAGFETNWSPCSTGGVGRSRPCDLRPGITRWG